MVKTICAGILVLALGACAARPAMHVTPEQRARAASVLLRGGTMHDVAVELAMDDANARRLVHSTIRELMRRYRDEQ